MTAAGSRFFGHRCVQIRHPTQLQSVWLESSVSTASSSPICTSRITWLGVRSMKRAIGHPAVHLPHW